MIDLETFAYRHGLPFDGRGIEIGGGRITECLDCCCFSTSAGGPECRRLANQRFARTLYSNHDSRTITFDARRLGEVVGILEGDWS